MKTVLALPCASAIAAASPAGPPPITTTSKAADVSFISAQLTLPAAFSSPLMCGRFSSELRDGKPLAADVQIGAIPDSTAGQMDQINQQDSSSASPVIRAAAFAVHVFTSFGAGVALIALLEAVREHWAAMFAWLGAALGVDALDGPVARRPGGARGPPDRCGGGAGPVGAFFPYWFLAAYGV